MTVEPSAGADENLPAPDDLDAAARSVLRDHWHVDGYTVPNAVIYPHQWLWDSCFHAVIWAHLHSPDRALAELRNAFAHQGPDGFVPHLTYWQAPGIHEDLWGRARTSCITQPPMYGHAIAELVRRGTHVPDDLTLAAADGLAHLLARRRTGGLVPALHPWETGCDDSPRWDAWCPAPWSRPAWKAVKGDLVASLAMDPDPVTAGRDGTGPVGNPAFHPGSVVLSALTAFNVAELRWATGPDATPGSATLDRRRRADLEADAAPLLPALELAWDDRARTWADTPGGGIPGVAPSRRVRTLEALLPTLVVRDRDQVAAALASLVDPTAFGAAHGPTQVHRGERTYDPDTYWRGPAWPQLSYLLWLAASRRGAAEVADVVATTFVAGAVRSGMAEHWHPDTGSGQGAQPQSWTGLAAVTWSAQRAGTPPAVGERAPR